MKTGVPINNDKKRKKITPAPYSPTSEQELIEITVLRTLLKPNRIRPHLSEEDKTPNIDGYLDLIDEKNLPLGKLEVQVKKLPDEFEEKPKFPCPTSLIVYARDSTTSPVLLICVDIHNNRAYWCSMDHFFVDKYYKKIEDGQQTITIHFPAENCLDGKNFGYLDCWKTIFNNYQLKIRGFDNLFEEHTLLRERSNPIVGVSKPEIREIHSYLDQLNRLLDFRFDIVKKTFFPNSWKIGFAYHAYDDEKVTYEHYPIPVDKNDVQIKQIDENLEIEIRKTRLELISYFKGNPIKSNPESLANKYVEDKVKLIFKNHLLDHKVDEIFAREFVFAFIDHFHIQMGLEEKDVYSIQEIDEGFFKYLPLWITEVASSPNINSLYTRNGFHDPDLYLVLTPPQKRTEIAKRIKVYLTEKSAIPGVLMGNNKYQFGIFSEMLLYLKLQNTREISRIYKKEDFTRLQTRSPGVWNAFSIEDVVRNLNSFFENYPRIYNAIIEKNFPNLKSEFPLFWGSAYIIVVYDVKDDYPGSIGFVGPNFHMYYFTSEKKQNIEINIISKEEFDHSGLIEEIKKENQICVHGQTFRYLTESWSILEFIYKDCPLFHFLYMDLQKAFQNYFKQRKNQVL